MKITVSIDDNLTFDLSAEHVVDILDSLANIEENADKFEALASHPAAAVRVAASRGDHLSVKTVTTLARDASAKVRYHVARNRAFKEHATMKLLLRVIKSDTDSAVAVADELHGYQADRSEGLDQLLKAHADPVVREVLADNGHTSERVLEELVQDEDRRVRSVARSTIRFGGIYCELSDHFYGV